MSGSCHSAAVATSQQGIVEAGAPDHRVIAIIGLGNSGKSMFFNVLTGRYSFVANYPHTTVEPNRQRLTLQGWPVEVVDTPGISSLSVQSDDERSTLEVLLRGSVHAILFCGDALRLQQSLVLLAQVLELGIPTLFCLNKSDEAARQGIAIDTEQLARAAGVPVVPTAAPYGRGMEGLGEQLFSAHANDNPVHYLRSIEAAVSQLGSLFSLESRPARGVLLQVLQGELSMAQLPGPSLGQDVLRKAQAMLRTFGTEMPPMRLSQSLFNSRDAWARQIEKQVSKRAEVVVPGFSYWAGWSARHPILGWPILLVILWLTFYSVGRVAAELASLLGAWFFDPLTRAVSALLTDPFLNEMIVGNFGLLTMGVINAIVTVVPILIVFFLIINFLEDVGYLPNLSVLATRAFAPFGLTGKAVLPIILGTGCNTVATLTSRIMESRGERIMVSFLIALGVPCAVQLGIMLAIFAAAPFSVLLVVMGTVVVTSVICGIALNRLMPARPASAFILELPALRWPSWRNIVQKTYYRIKDFLLEAMPLFVFAAALMFTLEKSGLLVLIKKWLHPVITGFLSMPDKVTEVFILVLSRREVGAVYFKDMVDRGELDYYQVITGLVVMTLFVPCISNTMVMIKELGARWAVSINLGIVAIAILVGGLVDWVIRLV
ncbi:MAG: ferrous iron transport protein B [Magnetococcales bacterium]|nr:ferrous iron transport protein B [Magnetococcales bacterium]